MNETRNSASFFGLRKVNFFTVLLVLCIFMSGASGIVSEYILSTVSTYILGNSTHQWALVIGLMLFTMGLGAFAQKGLSDKNLIEKFIVLEMILAILIGFSPVAMYWAFAMVESHFNLVQYFFISSIGFLIGFEIPVASRINARYQPELKTNMAYIYSADYIGSFLGALLFAYYFLKAYPLTETSFIMAALNFLVALFAFSFFVAKGIIKHKKSLISGIIFVSSSLVLGFSYNIDWNVALEQKLYDARIVFNETTRFQRLVITHDQEVDDYRLYINGNLQFSSIDEKIYHEQLVHPVMNLVPDHRKVLILGGGDGMALREVLKYKDVERVTLVDLDPDMTRLAANNPILKTLNENAFADARVKILKSGAVESEGRKPLYLETDRINSSGENEVERIAWIDVINVDADKFVDEIKESYNVIILDFPDPSSPELAKLYSKEFYMKLQRVLSESGMFVLQATSPYHAKEAFLCINRTIKAARFQTIPYHDNVPSFGDWGFMLAWKNRKPDEIIFDRIGSIRFNVETAYITPDVFRKALVFGKGWLDSDNTDITTLMNPRVLHYYIDESWKIGN